MEDVKHFAKVVQVMERTGGTGSLSMAKLELLQDKRRVIRRAIKGPVFVGDVLELLECEREHRRAR